MVNNLFLAGIVLIIILFTISSVSAEVILTEIMYAPGMCEDKYCEWVELFNTENETVNLTDWNISDLKKEDEITCCNFLNDCSLLLEANSFALIVDQDSKFSDYFYTNSSIFCVDDKAMGNSLSNREDALKLINGEGKKQDSFSYTKKLGGYKNNKTLERRSDGSWSESLTTGGTPGSINSIWNLSTEYASLIITEILPDPFGEDSAEKPDGEWVELFNTGKKDIDLKGLLLKDVKGKLPIAHNKVNNGTTVICAGCYKTVFRSKDSDFSLNRDFDEVSIFSEDNLITVVSYSGSTEGMSWSLVNNEWVQTEPTPGKENVFVENCDWGIDIKLDNSIITRDNFSFSIVANRKVGFKENITVKGQIENYYGEVVKKYSPMTNKKVTTKSTKKYSPKLKEGIYQLNFWYENLSCKDKFLTDNKATKLLAINPVYKKNDSSLIIERLYLGSDEEVEWGDQFTVKLNVYKGDETKKSVQLWAEKEGEKVSKTTKFNIVDDFKEYLLTLPIQLIPNCHEVVSSGTAKLVLEGFGLRTEHEFEIDGVDKDVCKDYLKYVKELKKEEKKNKKKSMVDFVNLPASVSPGQVIRLKVQIFNGDEATYSIWPFLYRGSKCYSCENGDRDALLKSVSLADNELNLMEFLLKVDDDLAEGKYKLKAMIKKKGRKTADSIIKEIYVKEINQVKKVVNVKNQSLDVLAIENPFEEVQSDSENSLSTNYGKRQSYGSGIVVYESSSVKAKKLIPTFLAITFGLLCLVLLFKKP